MSLIKCLECGKEISDQAEHCIYCGYPLSKIPKFEHSIRINGKEYDASGMLKDIEDYKNGKTDLKIFRKRLGYKVWECNGHLSGESIFALANTIAKTLEVPQEFNGVESSIQRCPRCSSANIYKLGFLDKASSPLDPLEVAMGLPFDGTWKCNNCGHIW